MQLARIRTIEQYLDYREKNAEWLQTVWQREKDLSELNKKNEFYLPGFSYPARQMVDFKVDYLYSDGDNVNWRERMICPVTGLNNRLRGCVHFIDFELGLRPYHTIYIAEQVTPLYDYLQSRFPLLIGSEYLGDNYSPGYIDKRGLRHETATGLSFSAESLDAYLSFECFEHIPDYKTGFEEASRVLRSGGKFMWSVPFTAGVYENIARAVLNKDGTIRYLLEPEYHGDPVSDKGILCFTHFGWQMLDQVKAAGFKNAYVLVYRSEIFGYWGNEQMLFIAEK